MRSRPGCPQALGWRPSRHLQECIPRMLPHCLHAPGPDLRWRLLSLEDSQEVKFLESREEGVSGWVSGPELAER